MRSYEMTEIGKRGLEACLDEAFEIALDDCDAVFLSVDIDVCDPGHAPGTGTPEPGGLTSRELLDAVRRICRELPVAGIDVVEVSPPYDHAEITAYLAQPGVPRGPLRPRRPQARHHPRPRRSAAGRALNGHRRVRQRLRLRRPPATSAGPTCSSRTAGCVEVAAGGFVTGLRPSSTNGVEVLDLGGRLVTPGFIDAHVHPILGGVESLACDLTGGRDRAAYVETIGTTRPGADSPWIPGGGWAMSDFPDGTPDRPLLDAWSRTAPSTCPTVTTTGPGSTAGPWGWPASTAPRRTPPTGASSATPG